MLIDNKIPSNLIFRSETDPQFTSIKLEHLCKINNIYHEHIPVNSPKYNAHSLK